MPEFNIDIIDNHKQLFGRSCIPSAVEMILKLEGKVDENYYDLQNQWNEKPYPDFSFFDGDKKFGLQFKRKYNILKYPRNACFPKDELFNEIRKQLNINHYVVVSLAEGANFHNYIIFKEYNDEFHAFTKFNSETKIEKHVKQRIKVMNGTDILVYEKI